MARILILLFLVFSTAAFGQQVRIVGKCSDKKGRPVEDVQVSSDKGNPRTVFTTENGRYELFASFGDTLKLRYYLSEEVQQRSTLIVTSMNLQTAPDIVLDIAQQTGVIVQFDKEDPFEIPKMPMIDLQKLPMNSPERFLTLTTAATSNNELTTNYNVRGGNYDENLVYVNGFNVYRPFLTRSGQQEGMSFINSALVQSIKFSAGGFEAAYGDKLSSVLDIEYKTPTAFHASAMMSLLGVEAHLEHAPTARFNYLVGARYRSNGYLLNSLPAKGAYNPVFWDAQFLTNYYVRDNLIWSVLGHFSSNDFRFAPETQETDFGTANEAYSFRIYFDGQEQTRFQTMMGGTSLKWKPNKRTDLDFYATLFNTVEREYYDIQGQYFINELETDPSKEEFGDSIAVLGVGTFLNHARNRLNATIMNVYHNGSFELKNGFTDDERLHHRRHVIRWGVNYQHDDFYDILSEWKMIDSAGYSLPQSNDDQITLFETIKGELSLTAERLTSFAQWNGVWSRNKRDNVVTVKSREKRDGQRVSYTDTIRESVSRLAFSFGARAGYTTINNEFFFTPRATLTYYPRAYMVQNRRVVRRDLNYRLSSGLYYQPPFYREFRTFDGQLRLGVVSQKSFHFVAGTDVYFNMWQREVPFKFTAEAYYKYLWDVNPYEIDNVRTRYYAENNAVAYAYGLDMNVHGQFVEGIESFFKVGLMSTREDVAGDKYTVYYNAAGERIIFGFTEDDEIADSVIVKPGFIPRPTDQWLTVGALIQDQMPGFERLSVQMGLQFGSRLPYGPPDFARYKDTLRIKSYFRVDIGMSYDFLHDKASKSGFFGKNFDDAILSFEVFNLLGVNNVLSKQWIQDVSGKFYSIPNYLTQRRFNLKLILRM
ncbi:MAG: TonB-dependent receptor plug domain-containing protein [Bacteroidota bacterium]